MKAILSLTFGILSSVGVCTGAASVASLVITEAPKNLVFRTASAPDLWTTTPVRVDLSRQSYERLPPVYSTYVTNPSPGKVAQGRPRRPAPGIVEIQPSFSTAHVNWCVDRYRSYDAATNTYRSYSGQTRSCDSPYINQRAAKAGERPGADPRFVAYGAENLRLAWCSARYRSYRADDNTYQPYSGPRRPCVPPAQAQHLEASNEWQ
ncbi:BA14K family protein [Pararhizobium arenae]|uniref:BA14K family protein n=1 Tax=Pararhizobium arenae TaxID=1856850 RepID=UPI00094AB1A6|nr:BA14K family protein [Pararhizobium arenae]